MSEYTNQHGTFCWLDLMTTDSVGAKKFYSEVFGWEIMDIPVAENMVYTMLNLKGRPVSALSDMQPEQKAMNIPPYWTSYVAVDDAAEIMEKVAENGGTVVLPVMQIMEEGFMGILQDPDGAFLGVWQAKNMTGFGYSEEPGTVCWFEHGCHYRDKAIPFLEKTFGWNSETSQMGDNLYTTFMLGEKMVAGLYQMTPEMSSIPSNWLPYFGISSIDMTLEKVAELGGIIIMPKMFVEGVGHFAVVQDPQGGVFGILQGE
jgi:uncharacterized protein